jgi:hypothetical protein
LRSIMEGILLDTMVDLPSLEGVEEVVISREVVEGTAPPLYIYAARASVAGASASARRVAAKSLMGYRPCPQPESRGEMPSG